MRTVTFKSILNGVATRAGYDPAAVLQDNMRRAIAEYLATRIGQVWKQDGWWPWTSIEERAYRATYDAGATYVEGAEVYYEGEYYRALSTTVGNLPTDEVYWVVVDNLERWIDLEQAGQGAMWDVKGLWSLNRLVAGDAVEIDYVLNGERLYVLESTLARVWVEFNAPPPVYEFNPWDAAETYATGAVVYVEATGECYRASQGANINRPPATEGDWWVVQPVPEALSAWLKEVGAADVLREDEQYDKARQRELRAETLLEEEFDRMWLKQKQSTRMRVMGR